MPAVKGRGKTRSWMRKNHQELTRNEGLQLPLSRRRANILHRVEPRKATIINDIIYRFLEDIDAVRTREMENSRIRRSERASNKTRKMRATKRLSASSFQCSETPSKSIFESTEDNESLTTAMESATTRPSSSCSNCSTGFSEPPVDSKKGVKDLHMRQSLINILNNYINVGIEAEKQRAKNYMIKAISYGVNSGFLKPVDHSGHLLEMSCELPRIKVNRDMAEERKQRKDMRRGTVNIDDYEMKSVKRRNASKLDHEKREKGGKIVPKKRARNSKSASKAQERNKEKSQLHKKRTKVASQAKSRRNTRSARTRRSLTPCRSFERSPSVHRNEELLDNNDRGNNNGLEGKSDEKEKIENRKMISIPLRKEDGENHMEDSSMHANLEQNFNLRNEIQESVEGAVASGK